MAVVVKIPAMVTLVDKHTEEICTLELKPLKLFPPFKPGQFLHLAVDPYDPSFPWPESRVFSIASSPSGKDKIRITFIVKGNFTRKMYNDINTGDPLWLKLPYGEFIIEEGKPSVLIAGGTGITPYISFLEQLLERKQSVAHVSLYYGVKEQRQFLYKDLLQNCASQLPGFKGIYYVENTSPSEETPFLPGRIDIENIFSMNNDADIVFYLSGPAGMITAFRKFLKDQGVHSLNIRSDEWA